MTALAYLMVVLLGYLLGSTPTGFLAARARGIDLRTVGSGNIGATNALRVLGKPVGILVLLADAAKGALACALFPFLAAWLWPELAPQREMLAIAAGVAAVVGHNYTCWLGFRGGKGIATSAGVLAVLVPAPLGLALAVWLVVFALSRYVSLASISAALALPVSVWVLGDSRTLIGVAIALAAMAIYKHRSNIARLMAGTESRFGRKLAADRRFLFL